LFRRILSDAAFAGGKTDTGYLNRLPQPAAPASDPEVVAIAAAIFASMDTSKNGQGQAQQGASSNWKRTARTESLR
jgi:hypothetical protein